jgi:hypothetical protein
MRSDVEIEVPGGSMLAGCHHGSDAVSLFLDRLQRVFVPAEQPLEFFHEGNEMVMSQILRAGITEWTHRYRIAFDESERIERIVFEPDDIRTFDVLVNRVFEPAAGLELEPGTSWIRSEVKGSRHT